MLPIWPVVFLILFHIRNAAFATQLYQVHDVILEALWPKGFRASIPDNVEVEQFSFHGKLNMPFDNLLQNGDGFSERFHLQDGVWKVQLPDLQLKPDDVVYYRLHVKVNGQSYIEDKRIWIVKSYANEKPASVNLPATTPSPSSPTEFVFPEATLEAMHPKGLRVSIPDKPGIELFAFHGNVNVPMKDLGAGMLSRDIVKTHNGRWVFEDTRTELKPGDIVYYWLYVIVDRLGYRKDNQMWTVPGIQESEQGAARVAIPAANLQVLLPRGLRVSIPDRDGLQFFSFHGSLNEPLSHLRNGTIYGDVENPKNGQWVFEDSNVCLKKGDVLRYWLYANIYNRDYFEGNLVWIVPGGDLGNNGEDKPRNCSSPIRSHSRPSLEETTASITIENGGQLPEGREYVVVVKDGKLHLKN